MGSSVTMLRAAGTAAIAAGALGAISGVRLSNDKFVGTWQGYGLGAAIGGGGAASIAGVWMLGKNVEKGASRLGGIALMGAAGGALLYGALGFSGAIDHKRQRHTRAPSRLRAEAEPSVRSGTPVPWVVGGDELPGGIRAARVREAVPRRTVARATSAVGRPAGGGVLSARTWWRTSAAALVAGVAVLVEVFLLTPATNLFAWGPALPLLGIGAVFAGLAGLVWTTRQLRPRGEVQRTAWAEWARSRRFILAEIAPSRRGRRAFGSPALWVRPSRSYTPVYTAVLDGGVRVSITNAYVHGPWGVARNRWLGNLAAVIDLPAGAAERFPASALDRYVRGRRPWRGRATARLRALHLESSDFEDACELRVAADSDELEWWRLLDPAMLDGLAREWAVSWQQHGRTLVVYVPAPVGTLDSRQLDAVCAAAVGIGSRFAAAGALPAPTSAEVAVVRERQGQRYRRRHAVRATLTWGLVLAVLLTPIVLITARDIREGNLDDDKTRSTYAAGTVETYVTTCIEGADDDAAREACATFDDGDRDRVLARPSYYYDEPGALDSTSVQLKGDVLTVTTVSEHGTRYVIRERVSDDSRPRVIRAARAGASARTGSGAQRCRDPARQPTRRSRPGGLVSSRWGGCWCWCSSS